MPGVASAPEKPPKKKARTAQEKPKQITQAQFRKLDGFEKRIYQAALETGDVTFKALQEAADISDSNVFTENANSLIRKHLLTIQQLGTDQVLKAVPLAQAKATGNLEDDVRLVLTVINDANDLGIWKRTLKTKTNLHAKTLNNCLRELEGRKLVKTVKGVKYPTRKLYMAYDLQPSTELTGGPWYTQDRDLDTELIESLLRECEAFIACESCVGGDRTNETMYPKAYWPFFPALWHVSNRIKEAKLLPAGTDLNEGDYQDLLDILVADGKIEALKIKRHAKDVWQTVETPKKQQQKQATKKQKRKRKRILETGYDSEDIDEEDSEEDDSDDDVALPTAKDLADPSIKRAGPPGSEDYIVYRTVQVFAPQGETPVPLGILSGLLDTPCGVCPVRQHCDNSGKPRYKNVPPSLVRRRKPNLALIIPSASDYNGAAHGDGVWRGGGSRGSSTKGQVHPEECIYYDRWMQKADEVPPREDWATGLIAGYPRDPYDW